MPTYIIFAHMQELTPSEKPKFLCSNNNKWGSPENVLGAIKSGIDIFDSTYVYNMTENAVAFTFICKGMI